MSKKSDDLYPVMDGVIMQPGVPVFCDDRDEAYYNESDVIAAARSLGHGTWEFDVRQIWPAFRGHP